MSTYPNADRVLKRFAENSRIILGENLVGVYLHGSAAMGCYHPAKSDLDLIAVIRHGMADDCKRRFLDMVMELDAALPGGNAALHRGGIEMSVVLEGVCRPFVYPTPFELHYSRMHLERCRRDPGGYIRDMRGTDRDLAAHFTVIRRRGVCLCGKPVGEVFGEVPETDYLDAIMEDVAGAREEIADNTMYLTLNLARVLAYRQEGLVLSKKEGGEWALKHLPPAHHPLIRTALADYESDEPVCYDPDAARRYADDMLGYLTRQGDDGR